MTRNGSIRGFVGRSLTVGSALVVLAAGSACAITSPVTKPAPAQVAAAVRPSNSDLEVIRIDPSSVAPGSTTTVHALIGNTGPDRTASPFTVVITLPEGVTPEGPFFPEDCTEFQNGHRVRCVFPAGLPRFRSATAVVPVRIADSVPIGDLTGGYVAVRSEDDRNPDNNRQPFTIHVAETGRD
ncbi:hypothetical protein [Embleya hyalina]|uniref:DUF11 domain-containing protein n=1 Tax=Embleya hyalina TaxID=516124 RepID=A0A401YEG7_9ACTN|nr:hypothetical protein [Embleya hyalina]GCD92975.1 hypothetical protein EHYA_00618 [Embleya hyalina]